MPYKSLYWALKQALLKKLLVEMRMIHELLLIPVTMLNKMRKTFRNLQYTTNY